MKRIIKNLSVLFILFSFSFSGFAATFNSNLTVSDKETIKEGKVLIKKINSAKNMGINPGINSFGDELIKAYKDLSPKYLAEVIQIKPYAGNEDLPERLNELLENISDYAGIPYYSVKHDRWFDLYKSAEITSEKETENGKEYTADIVMDPFGTINQSITIKNSEEGLLYDSVNLNKLTFQGKIDCVSPKKMKLSIFLFREGNYWVLYGIGGVNAPKIPLFTERIETSFMNRIKTFCNYIFEKI